MKTNSLILSVLLSLSQTNLIFCASQSQNTPAQRPGLFGSMTKGVFCGALAGASLYGTKYGAQLLLNYSATKFTDRSVHALIERTAELTGAQEFKYGCGIIAACSTLYFAARFAANAHEKFGRQEGLKDGLQQKEQTHSEKLLEEMKALQLTVDNNHLAAKEALSELAIEVRISNNMVENIFNDSFSNLEGVSAAVNSPVATSTPRQHGMTSESKSTVELVEHDLGDSEFKTNVIEVTHKVDTAVDGETTIDIPQTASMTSSGDDRKSPNNLSWVNVSPSRIGMNLLTEVFFPGSAYKN